MTFQNPYRPGAGHRPPHLAGRQSEIREFSKLLEQSTILENAVLTGLRGVGKTVLLDEFKPLALKSEWLWVGSDLSETTSVSENNLAIRLLADLSVATSTIIIAQEELQRPGFTARTEFSKKTLDYNTLLNLYENIPGLATDKLKGVLEIIHTSLPNDRKRIIFAYDEAQNLDNNAQNNEYPLSVLLDVFQSIQRKGIQFMLVLAGLPTLFPKLVEARTYSERMFRVLFLDKLDDEESREAIVKPLDISGCPVRLSEKAVSTIIKMAGGYPYFIQFICREVYDVWVRDPDISVPTNSIMSKLDSDFFAGRWARATDRQRELMILVSQLPTAGSEFTVQEIAEASTQTEKPFGSSQINQMLSVLIERGLIYKNRHGKYSFAVPLLERFIRRQVAHE